MDCRQSIEAFVMMWKEIIDGSVKTVDKYLIEAVIIATRFTSFKG